MYLGVRIHTTIATKKDYTKIKQNNNNTVDTHNDNKTIKQYTSIMDLSAYQPRNSNQNNTTTPQNNHDTAKIFVGGLSWQSNEETLRYHFEQFGEVVSVEVMRDRNTGNPRGFAFVVFKDDATVDLVMNNLPQEINHKIVDVKRAQAKGERERDVVFNTIIFIFHFLTLY